VGAGFDRGLPAPVRPIRLTLDPLRGAWLPANLLAAQRLWIIARVDGDEFLHVIGDRRLKQLRAAFWEREASIVLDEPADAADRTHNLMIDPALLKPTARANVFTRGRCLHRLRVEVTDAAAAIDPPPTIAVVLRGFGGRETRLSGVHDRSLPILVPTYGDRRVTLEVSESPGGSAYMRRGDGNRWVLEAGDPPPSAPSGVRLTLTDAETPVPVRLRVGFREVVEPEPQRFSETRRPPPDVERVVQLDPERAPVALLPPGRWRVNDAEVLGLDPNAFWAHLLVPEREFIVEPGAITDLALSPLPPDLWALPLEMLHEVVIDLRVEGLAEDEAISGRMYVHLIDGDRDLGFWGATADDPQLRPLTPDAAAPADSPWPGMRVGDPTDRRVSGARLTDARYLLRFESPRDWWRLMNRGDGSTRGGPEVRDAVQVTADRWHGILTLSPPVARHELGPFDAIAPLRVMRDDDEVTVAVDPPGGAPEWLAEASVVDPVIGVAPRSGTLVLGPAFGADSRGRRLHVAGTATRTPVIVSDDGVETAHDRHRGKPSEVGSVTVSLPGRTPGIFAHIWDETGTRYTVDLARVPRKRPESVEFPVATGRVYAMLSTSRDGAECAGLIENRRRGGDRMNHLGDDPPTPPFVQFLTGRGTVDLPDLRRVYLGAEPTPVATMWAGLKPIDPWNGKDTYDDFGSAVDESIWRFDDMRSACESPDPVWLPVGRYLLRHPLRPDANDRQWRSRHETEILIPRGRGPLVIDLARW
jgi:hypothetical protein